MKFTTVDGEIISYPDLGFAFNPLYITIENYTGVVIVEVNNIKIEKEAFAAGKCVSIDISAIARSLFDRNDFHKMEHSDNSLFKTLNFKISSSTKELHSGNIPVIWGALQIGETYSQNKTLSYFKGYPFTVPIYVEEDLYLQVKEDKGEFKDLIALNKGKFNLDITQINAVNTIEFQSKTEKYYKIFDYTFDSSFGPQKVAFYDKLDIRINIVDCPQGEVYLRWINKYGEYHYYLFQTGEETSVTKNNPVSFNTVYNSTSLTKNYHPGTSRVVGKEIENSIKLYASLVDTNTYNLLKNLVESPVVDMFMGYDKENNAQWIAVETAEGTFVQTGEHLQDFEFLLVPPQKQVQYL